MVAAPPRGVGAITHGRRVEEGHGETGSSAAASVVRPSANITSSQATAALALAVSQLQSRSQSVICSSRSVARRAPPQSRKKVRMLQVLAITVVLAAALVLHCYRKESMCIGFCLDGTATNAILEERGNPMRVIGQDVRTRLDGLDAMGDDPSRHGKAPASNKATCWTAVLADILSFSPEDCTPCPAHSTCTPCTVTCNRGFVIAPPLALSLLPQTSSTRSPTIFETADGLRSQGPIVGMAYAMVLNLFDGLPGIGPVSFPPSCVEDTERAYRERVVHALVVEILESVRGDIMCQDHGDAEDGNSSDVGEAQRWGLQLQNLKSRVARQISVSARAPSTFPFAKPFVLG